MRKILLLTFVLLFTFALVAQEPIAPKPVAPAPMVPTAEEQAQLALLQKDVQLKFKDLQIMELQYAKLSQEWQAAVLQLNGAGQDVAKKHKWDATFDAGTLTFTPKKEEKKAAK